jgi:hypothetical protein
MSRMMVARYLPTFPSAYLFNCGGAAAKEVAQVGNLTGTSLFVVAHRFETFRQGLCELDYTERRIEHRHRVPLGGEKLTQRAGAK